MLKVKIFSFGSVRSAEDAINKFISKNPTNEIVDIKIGGDGHSSCITYVIMYKENDGISHYRRHSSYSKTQLVV